MNRQAILKSYDQMLALIEAIGIKNPVELVESVGPHIERWKADRAVLAQIDGEPETHYCRNEHASGLTFGKAEDCKLCEKDRQFRANEKAALTAAPEPADIHSKIDMDIEDAIGREITFEESQLIGLAVIGAQNPEKPQWWKDVEWLAELRKKPVAPPVSAPPGFVLVPIKATKEIKDVMRQCEIDQKLTPSEAWEAMLDTVSLPVGYVLIPAVPTEEIITQMSFEWTQYAKACAPDLILWKAVYAALINSAAAPSPPHENEIEDIPGLDQALHIIAEPLREQFPDDLEGGLTFLNYAAIYKAARRYAAQRKDQP